jgi:GT2 family glycosyltransferase
VVKDPSTRPHPGPPSDLIVLGLPREDSLARVRRGLLRAAARQGWRVIVVMPARSGSVELIREQETGLWEATIPAGEGETAEEVGRALEGLDRPLGSGQVTTFVQSPRWAVPALAWQRERSWPVVYDALALWEEQEGIPSSWIEAEGALLAGADLVLAADARLMRRWQDRAKRLLLVPAGAETAGSGAGLRVGVAGVLGEWLDLQRLVELVEARPDWSFGVAALAPLPDPLRTLRWRPNVELRTVATGADLVAHLARHDLSVLPLLHLPGVHGAEMGDFLTVLGAGPPLVATPLASLARFAGRFVPARTAAEFVTGIAGLGAAAERNGTSAGVAASEAESWDRRWQLVVSHLPAAAGAPESDPAGWPAEAPDSDEEAFWRRLAEPNLAEPARHEIVWWASGAELSGSGRELATRLREALSRRGHRLFVVAAERRRSGPVLTCASTGANQIAISLRETEDGAAVAASFDRLRRELGMGATLQVLESAAEEELAAEFESTLGWPVVALADNGPQATDSPVPDRNGPLRLTPFLALPAPRMGVLRRVAMVGLPDLPITADAVRVVTALLPAAEIVLLGPREAIPDWTGVAERLEVVDEIGDEELASWLGTVQACLLPLAGSPAPEEDAVAARLWQLVASGRPVVAGPWVERFAAAPQLTKAGSLDELGGLLADGGIAAAERIEAARAAARERSWEPPAEALAAAWAAAFPRLSVVIVAHGNRELTRACLQSVAARTDWPNLEIVAVDNGSEDGTAEMLAECARTLPELRVIVNPDNRGFARATNQGLARATGDYLVLLNNDTVVSRGWATALIGHLRRDPGLGMVGPSTNQIANESKVEVGYDSLAGMPGWSRQFVRRHDRVRADIPMLAMFCVALRRRDLERVGPLDESFEIGLFEDDDYATRLREAGLELAVARDAFVHHVGGAAFARLDERATRILFARNRERYEQKWGAWRPSDGFWLVEEHRRELAALGAPGFVFFAATMRHQSGEWERNRQIARVLACSGRRVAILDRSGVSDEEPLGFSILEPGLYGFRGSLEVLRGVAGGAIWVGPCNAHFADRLAGIPVIYDLSAPPANHGCRPEVARRNHDRMLARAALVTSSDEELLTRFAPDRAVLVDPEHDPTCRALLEALATLLPDVAGGGAGDRDER